MSSDPTYLELVRGSGTFVSSRVDYRISDELPPSTTATLLAAGVTPEVEVVSIRVVPAAADVALHLDIERTDPLLVLRRRITVEGIPAMWTTAHLPAALVPGLEELAAAGGSLHAVLVERFGLSPRRRWSRASLELPHDGVVGALTLEGRPPCWLVEGVNEDEDRTRVAVEFTRTWMRADVINVVFEMGRPPEVVR